MVAWLALALSAGAVARADVVVKDGQKIAFLGDSITAGGWGDPAGYVRLVVAGLQADGLRVEAVPAGVGGHKSNQMLARLEKDVLSKKPDWMTLSCGVNDVWHGAGGVPLDQYRTNITAIVEQTQAAGVKVMILTATVIGEDLDNADNVKLAPYNEFLRKLAKDKKCLLADLNADFQKELRAGQAPGKKELLLTTDGVHMNGPGNQVMALGILQAFGMDDSQMAKARESWADVAGTAVVRAVFDAGDKRTLNVGYRTTLRLREKLLAVAKRQDKTLDQFADALLAEELNSLVKPGAVDRIFDSKRERALESLLLPGFGRRLEDAVKD